jgi:sec-independent protein translocase protein TatA
MAYENVILVLVAVGLILFGSRKLPELFKSLGRAKVEYEKAKIESKNELAKVEQALKPPDQKMDNKSNLTREKLEEMASKLGVDEHESISDNELREKILDRLRQGS